MVVLSVHRYFCLYILRKIAAKLCEESLGDAFVIYGKTITFVVMLKADHRRRIAAWLLLLVYVPVMVAVSLHVSTKAAHRR